MTIDENQNKLNTAIKYHQSGQLPEAEIIYRKIIKEEPENFNALNLFGVLLFQHERYEEAIEYINKAINLNPSPYFYINLASVYLAKEQPDDAIDCYKQAIKMEPTDPDPWFGIGVCYKSKNEPDKAIEYYEKTLALDTSYSSAYINMGNIYNQRREYDKAIENYKKAILFKQDDPEAYNSLGLIYFDRYELDEAVYCYKKAINLKPNYEDAYINLGNVYKVKGEITLAIQNLHMTIEMNPDNYKAYVSLGELMLHINKIKEAIDCFETAQQVDPNNNAILLNLGNAYKEAGDLDAALSYYLKAMELMPDKAEVYVNLGNIYSDTDDINKAVEFYKKAIELNPELIIAYLNLGHLYICNNNIEEAFDYYKKAYEINPDYAETNLNLGTTYLLKKDFPNGFRHYIWRDKVKDIKHPQFIEFKKPVWTGEPLKDKTILVCHEQGLGDSLQFARYLPQLASLGGKVLYKVPDGMEELFKQADLNAEIVDNSLSEDQLEFDYYTYLLNLPLYLNTTYDSIPLTEGYLKANPKKVKAYKEKYFDNDNFKIGIKWQGNPYGNKSRAIPLKIFLKLANIENVKLYSFQKGYGQNDLEKVPKKTKIVDLGSTFDDFSDTAAALENLDLLICNDTSLAHLSGALGKQTWILLPFVPEWRWFTEQEDSPWYKSVRLFRQKEKDNWQEVMRRVVKALKTKLNAS